MLPRFRDSIYKLIKTDIRLLKYLDNVTISYHLFNCDRLFGAYVILVFTSIQNLHCLILPLRI